MPIIPKKIRPAAAERLLAFLNTADSPEALRRPGAAARPPTDLQLSSAAAKALWDQRNRLGGTFKDVAELADVAALTDQEVKQLVELFSTQPAEPPVKQPPVKDPPVEQPPVEQPPVKDPPVEQPPDRPTLPTTPVKALIEVAKLDRELVRELDRLGLRTLGDVAAKGGVMFGELAKRFPPEQLRLVDAHASLALVQPDLAINQELYRRGVTSARELAALDPATVVQFERELANNTRGPVTLPVREAGLLVLEGVAAALDDHQAGIFPEGSPHATACDCADCRTAWSPLAYVADLLDYTLDHVRDGNRALAATELAKLLGQPVDQFTADCRHMHEEVCAKRIACEVLRAHAAGLPPAGFHVQSVVAAERRGLALAYDALLAELGVTFTELRDARLGSAERRARLAERLCVDEARLADLLIDPADPQALTEDALERIFGLRSTRRFPLDVQPAPQLAAWRRACIEARWRAQDLPLDVFERGERPFLDPDVVTFDDLRVAGDVNDPIRNLWWTRRNQVVVIADGLQGLGPGPALAVDDVLLLMFGALPIPQQLGPLTHLNGLLAAPWSLPGVVAPSLINIRTFFDQSASDLRAQTNVDATRAALQQHLHLASDAFLRLADLDRKFRSQLALTVAEEREFVDLCVLGWKEARVAQWVADEQTARSSLGMAILDGRLCWRSLTEPLDDLPVHLDERGVPCIDPDFVQRAQLPDRDDGAPALLAARTAQLAGALQDLIARRQTAGFADLWAHVYAAATPSPSYAALWSDFTANVPGIDARIVAETHLSVDDFNRVMEVVNLGTSASDRDWELVCRLLHRPHKRLNLYPAWLADESTIPRFQLLKACVDPWRAPRSARDAWVAALERRLEWPVIVPGRVLPEELVALTSPAGQLLTARRTQLIAWRAAWWPASFTALVPAVVGVSLVELDDLVARLDAGARVAPRLRQLGLAAGDLRLLKRLCDLASAGPSLPVLASEREEGLAVLAKVKIGLLTAAWQLEERVAGVYRTPAQFAPPPAPAPAPTTERSPADEILAPSSVRRALTSLLSARAEAARGLDERLDRAVRAAEELELRVLIDGLVDAIVVPGVTGRDARAEWLTDRLFVDVKNDCCGRTTRAMQLAESLQSLLHALRNGLAVAQLPTLRLQAPNFDDEWKWIGSYPAWRSAMLVFLYPENLLHPGLRPDRSPAFRALQDELRRAPRLTARAARDLADSYERYLLDLDALTVLAFLDVTYQSDTVPDAGSMLLQVGRAGATHYYCVSERPSAVDPGRPGYWQPFPALVGNGEVKVLGMAHYRPSDGRDFGLLVFTVSERGRTQIRLLRFDFLLRTWSTESTELVLVEPGTGATVDTFQVVLEQRRFAPQGGSPLALWVHAQGSTAVVAWSLTPDLTRLERPQSHEIRSTWLPDFRLEAAIAKTPLYVHVIIAHAGVVRYADSVTQNWTQGLLLPAVTGNQTPNQRFVGAIDHRGRQYAAVEINGTITLTALADFGNAPSVPGLPFPAGVRRLVFGAGETQWPHRTVFERGGTDRDTWSDLFTLPPGSGLGIRASGGPVRETPSAAYNSFVIYPGGLDRRGAPATAAHSQALWARNTAGAMNPLYVSEAQYAVPMLIALQLAQAGLHGEAVDWLRTVYDYSQPLAARKRWYGLVVEETITSALARPSTWLADPLSPHASASGRRLAHTRYVILTLVRTLLAWADAEYTRDTPETLPRARALYREALELLALLAPTAADCAAVIAGLTITVGDPFYENAWRQLAQRLFAGVRDRNVLAATIDRLNALLASGNAPSVILNTAEHIVADVLAHDQQTIDWLLLNRADWRRSVDMLGVVGHFGAIWEALHGAASPGPQLPVLYAFNSLVDPNFCVPPNPIVASLVLRAEINLFKLRHCLNIAGVPRSHEPWGGDVDRASLLASVGADGNLSLPGAASVQPGIYRYRALLERAKELVAAAQQVEAAYLGALEKRDAEAWTMLQAQQGLETARATVRVHDLRVSEAEAGISLAELQAERARFMVDKLQEFIESGFSEYETEILSIYQQIRDATIMLAMIRAQLDVIGLVMAQAQAGGNLATAIADKAIATTALVLGTIGVAFRTGHEVSQADQQLRLQQLTMLSAKADREDDWRYQQSLARFDVRVGEQQIQLAELRTRVVAQERTVAQMQADHAQQAVDFLSRKFTNVELYDWMTEVLGGVYAFFLRLAAATAQQAAAQLAFERQSLVPPFIQQDYWDAPADGDASGAGDRDRRGLTGSARLLQDLHRLDQHAFDTRRRQLELSRTFSLVLHDPIAFLRFRETGVLPFTTALETFDRDFPGHYLRLVRRVRVSVIALVPSTQGIRATLSSTGISRVVVGGDVFAERVLRREPERIAFTGSQGATGQLGLDPVGDVLDPFEGSGVAASWELRMDRAANPIDFSTISDVLVTIEYTALHSSTYETQVRGQLDPSVRSSRFFSLRSDFSDAWYDLHNPQQSATPLSVQLDTSPRDFPPNLLDPPVITNVQVYVALAPGAQLPVAFALALDLDTVTGQQRGGAGPLFSFSASALVGRPAVGRWRLTLADIPALRALFDERRVTDILLVVDFSGTTG